MLLRCLIPQDLSPTHPVIFCGLSVILPYSITKGDSRDVNELKTFT